MTLERTKYRFTTSTASDRYAYDRGQVVILGESYSDREIPLAHGEQLIASGILIPAEDPLPMPKHG